jgi:hypothetical protein
MSEAIPTGAALADAKTAEALIAAWDLLAAEHAGSQYQQYIGSMTGAFIPTGREPFLPYSARSGWQLLTVLESQYGFSIFGSDLMQERDIIRLCLDHCEKRGGTPS